MFIVRRFEMLQHCVLKDKVNGVLQHLRMEHRRCYYT